MNLDFQAFISLVKMKQRIEYRIAAKNGKFKEMVIFVFVEM